MNTESFKRSKKWGGVMMKIKTGTIKTSTIES